MAELDAVVLAGGRSSRLGGDDKARLQLNGTALVDRVIQAARRQGAARVIVVGEPDVTMHADEIVRETPRFSGPAAAVAAGLARVTAEQVLVLSCDLVDPDGVCGALSQISAEFDGVLLEEQGFRQWLAGRYRVRPLREAFADAAEPLADQPLRAVLATLRLQSATVPVGLSADIDTPEDYAVAQARRREDAHG